MIGFEATIRQFNEQAEKTGWTYVLIPASLADKLKPGNKKSFRVKGKIDDHKIKSVALMPMGGGTFIMSVNAVMRKAIRKSKGAMVTLEIEVDTKPLPLSAALLECLEDDPEGKRFFESLSPSHQHYYSNWIESARTDATKTKRIALAINAFSNKLTYGQMIQMSRKDF